MSVLKFDSQQCARIRRQLDAYLSNELLVETTGEILKHLENCEDCSCALESRTRVREALRKVAEKQLPSETLGNAIHQRLMNELPRTFEAYFSTKWMVALASLAVVLVTVVAGQQWMEFRHGKELIASILDLGVTDHLECAVKGHNYPEVAASADVLRKKLGPEYADLLPVVEEKLPGFQVLEAHICDANGGPRKYVHFIARGEGSILSVIFTRRNGESFPTGRFLAVTAPAGVDLYRARLGGFSVAGFESREYFGFVVSSLDLNQTSKIAASLAPAARQTLQATAAFDDARKSALLFEPGFSRISRPGRSNRHQTKGKP
jgi:hypothetical protein